jgi:hypothetical protein
MLNLPPATRQPPTRRYLACSYSERHIVKQLGAKWDHIQRAWYIPTDIDDTPFQKWLERGFHPGTPGIGGLYVDLVPQTAWFSNVRAILTETQWRNVRSQVAENARHQCQICQGRGSAHAVEAHERWSFHVETQTQVLLRIEALCPACHQVTHFGRYQTDTDRTRGLARLQYVNQWDAETALAHVHQQFRLWAHQSTIKAWELKLDALSAYLPQEIWQDRLVTYQKR